MKFVATLAFKKEEAYVALVRKDTKKLPHLNGKWNGIGGKMEIGESPVGAAMREFFEETGIRVEKDNMVFLEHQIYTTGIRMTESARYCVGDEIYWYATRVDPLAILPSYNDVGERMHWERTYSTSEVYTDDFLAPNVGWLIHKAITYLRTPYLDLPA